MPQKLVTFIKRTPGLVSISFAGETFVMRGVSAKSFTVPATTPNPVLSGAMRGITVSVSPVGAPSQEPQVSITAPEEQETPVTAKKKAAKEPKLVIPEISTADEENTPEAPDVKKGAVRKSGKRKKG